MRGLKLAVSGKGGVGKTTLTVLLAREAARRGNHVFLVDADPDANLAVSLGAESEPQPLSEHPELIAERTGGATGLLRLNPWVEDLPDRCSVVHESIRLVTLGAVRTGGGGCACPGSSLLKAFLMHVLLQRDELVIVDMEAGIEHLGRGTVQGVDGLLVVMDPDRRSWHTARRITRLARELGVRRMWAVANKLASEDDRVRIQAACPEGLVLVGGLDEWKTLQVNEVGGISTPPSPLAEEVGRILTRLQAESSGDLP